MRTATITFILSFFTLSLCAQTVDYISEGDKMYNQKNYKGALENYTKAIQNDSKDPEAYLLRGRANYKLKEYKAAIDDYNQILIINPAVRAINWVYIYRGLAKSALEMHQAARDDYAKAFDDLSTSDEMEAENYNFHTMAWPNLDQMKIIQNSFRITSNKANREGKFIEGKWVISQEWGGKIVTFLDGVYTSTWGSRVKKTYEVLYSTSNLIIMTLDSLTGTQSKTYDYCVVKVVKASGEEGDEKEALIDTNQLVMRDYGDSFFSELQLAPTYRRLTFEPRSRINREQMNEAMRLLGLKERDQFIFGQLEMSQEEFNYDDEVGMNIYEALGLKVPAPLDEKTISALENTAAFLDPFYAYLGYFPVSLMLLKNSKIMEAAFMLYLGQLRWSYSNYKGGYDMFERPISQLVNSYLNDHVEASVQIRQKAMDYYMAHETQYAPPRKEQPDVYNRQIAYMKKDISSTYSYRAGQKKEEGDLKGAIADYTLAIEAFPENSEAYMGRGQSKHELEDFAGEIIDYNKVIEMEPEYAEPYYYRGMAKRSLEQNDSSCADFNKALELGQYQAQEAVLRYCTKEKESVTLDPKILQELAGKYDFGGEEMFIGAENNKLYFQPESKDRIEFFAEDETHFFSKMYFHITIEFIREQGKVTGMILKQGGRPFKGKKME